MDELIEVPSGQEVRLQEVIQGERGPSGLTVRYRFVAPEIGDEGDVDFEAASEDLAYLCDTYAVPRIPSIGPQPSQIIVSMSDRETPFGAATPEAVQYFEAFSVVDGKCVWEAF